MPFDGFDVCVYPGITPTYIICKDFYTQRNVLINLGIEWLLRSLPVEMLFLYRSTLPSLHLVSPLSNTLACALWTSLPSGLPDHTSSESSLSQLSLFAVSAHLPEVSYACTRPSPSLQRPTRAPPLFPRARSIAISSEPGIVNYDISPAVGPTLANSQAY